MLLLEGNLHVEWVPEGEIKSARNVGTWILWELSGRQCYSKEAKEEAKEEVEMGVSSMIKE